MRLIINGMQRYLFFFKSIRCGKSLKMKRPYFINKSVRTWNTTYVPFAEDTNQCIWFQTSSNYCHENINHRCREKINHRNRVTPTLSNITLGTSFGAIWIKLYSFSFRKINMKSRLPNDDHFVSAPLFQTLATMTCHESSYQGEVLYV